MSAAQPPNRPPKRRRSGLRRVPQRSGSKSKGWTAPRRVTPAAVMAPTNNVPQTALSPRTGAVSSRSESLFQQPGKPGWFPGASMFDGFASKLRKNLDKAPSESPPCASTSQDGMNFEQGRGIMQRQTMRVLPLRERCSTQVNSAAPAAGMLSSGWSTLKNCRSTAIQEDCDDGTTLWRSEEGTRVASADGGFGDVQQPCVPMPPQHQAHKPSADGSENGNRSGEHLELLSVVALTHTNITSPLL
mgnify:CR=1 FL=1